MRSVVVLIGVTLLATPAFAKEFNASGKSDPNRVICRTSEIIGSRLGTKKTCLTAMQWDQMRREQRDVIEKVQSFKPVLGA